MNPRFNSNPSQFPNRNQPNGTNPPFQSQGFSANPVLPDLFNVLQTSMPLQPQLGAFNPQFPLPFNNPSFPIQNMAALIAQQPALMNQLGIALQNQANSMSTIPNPMFMNQLNSFQPQPQGQGQPFPVNFPNFPQQQFNQNVAFANLQNLMHNLNPVMPTQLPNPSQFVGPRPQNPNFFPNPQFASGGQEANTNQKNFAEEKRSNQIPQAQNSRQPVPFRNQGKPVNNSQNNSSTSNPNNFPRKDFRKNMNHQKQFPHTNNGKRKFGNSKEHKGTGSGNDRAAKSGCTDSTEQAGEKKRSYAITYTEQEIKLWREERKKNHPSNVSIKKKLDETKTNSDVFNEEAKLRIEQLKEILAKQAELGVEVAEIPSHYLSDSEKRVNLREDNGNISGKWEKSRNKHDNGNTSGKWEKSRNKHDKRGRRNKRDRFGKKKASANIDSLTTSSFNKKEHTLLQKLLSADMRRDKLHLLQVFKFMVANKFFVDFPEKTLEFPQVVVKEEEAKNGAESGKSKLSGRDFSKIGKKTVENVGLMHDAEMESERCSGEGNCNVVEEINRIVEEEEEGEIIN